MPSSSFAIDFHVHTSFSYDSLTPPKMAVEVARRRGLAGIAVTDHETVEGALVALEWNPYSDFLIIPGVEVATEIGDVIGLYVTRNIKSRIFAEVVGEIHAQGGLTYLPHPLRIDATRALLQSDLAPHGIDIWEVYNGRYGRKQFALAQEALSRIEGCGRACGSDAHAPWEIGAFRTLLGELPRNPQNLLELSRQSSLVAVPVGDLQRRTGTVLGALIKAKKQRRYADALAIALSLPWKAARRIARNGQQRGTTRAR